MSRPALAPRSGRHGWRLAVAGAALLALAVPGGPAHAAVAGSTLTGSVGLAAAGTVVSVWQRDGGVWSRYAYANVGENGTYTALDLPDGVYAVTYEDPDFGMYDVNADGVLGTPSAGQAGVAVTSSAGGTLDYPLPAPSASITLGSGPTSITDVTGATITSGDALRLYALVDVGDGPEWGAVPVPPTHDGSTGAFQFAGLPGGTYAVAIESSNDRLYLDDGAHVRAWNTRPPTDGSLGLALGRTDHPTVAVALYDSTYAGTLSLTGPGPNTAPAPAGTMVGLLRYAAGAWQWADPVAGPLQETGMDGSFAFSGLPAGSYRLAVLDADGTTAELSDGTTVPAGTFAQKLSGQVISGAAPSAGVTIVGTNSGVSEDVTLPATVAAASTLSGTVTDQDGSTVQPGASVMLLRYDPASGTTSPAVGSGDVPALAITDAAGSYRFGGLPAGYYLSITSYRSDGVGFVPGTDSALPTPGIWLDGAATRTAPPVVLTHTPAPSSGNSTPPSPSASPSTSPTASASPSPTTTAKVTPTPTPTPSTPPVLIGPAVPGVVAVGVPAVPTLTVLAQNPAAVNGPPPVPIDQTAVNQAVQSAINASIQQSGGAQTGPPITVNAPAMSNPGLYLQVLDGTIAIGNPSGSQIFAAGQFGFTSTSQMPPVILPSNPGLQFNPPPAFTNSISTQISSAGAPGNIDCLVRRSDTTGSIQKMYCNRIAVDGRPKTGAKAGTKKKHAWHRQVTVKVKHGQRRVRLRPLRVHGPGWYRIVTTYHLTVRFTERSDHGKPVKHPITVTRPASISTVVYVHLKRH